MHIRPNRQSHQVSHLRLCSSALGRGDVSIETFDESSVMLGFVAPVAVAGQVLGVGAWSDQHW